MQPMQLPMTEFEARSCVERIRSGLDGLRESVLDLYEREGWRSLGYGSWRECVVAEFGQSQRHLYRALEAGRIERELSNWTNEPVSLTESHARELARLKEPETIREVWQEVRESTPEPTARDIRQAVDRRINPPQQYVCTNCGQVHPTRECPDCAEPDDEADIAEALEIVYEADPSERANRRALALTTDLRTMQATIARLIAEIDPNEIIPVISLDDIEQTRGLHARFADWQQRFERAVPGSLRAISGGRR